MDLTELIKAEISHNISPVIGWLRRDAVKGVADTDGKRLAEYNSRVDKAAESIAALVKERHGLD